MQYHEIDLDAYEKTGMTNSTLHERKQVEICGVKFQVTGTGCLTVASIGSSMALGIANLVYTKSQSRTCTPQEFDNVNYQYAVRAKGNCYTTAQRETIEGAIDHYIDENFDTRMCGVQCMKLTHGGNWQGYVVFGKPDYDWRYYLDMCASVSKLGHCESGGKKYVGDI